MTDKQHAYCIQNVPVAYRGTYRKAMTGRKPLAAIRAKCQDCQHWQPGEIRNCPIETCPLWPNRMGRMVRATGSGASKNPKRLRVSGNE